MNPFANPEEAMVYTYEEFPKPEETVGFELSAFDQELNPRGSTEGFVDFLNFDASTTANDAPIVQNAIFQDFKEVLSPAQG